MKDTSKVIIGATLVLVVSLAFVLGLILVLLAELYCSLLLRRRRLRTATATTTASAAGEATTVPSLSSSQGHSSSSSNHNPNNPSPTTPLSSFYAQGVLQAPRSLLFPAVSFREDRLDAKKQQLSEYHHQVIDIPTRPPPPPPPPPSVSLSASPKPFRVEISEIESIELEPANFVYISNPIYENPENRSISSSKNTSTEPSTPFETPDTSPSRLEEMGGSSSSGEDDDEVVQLTPPLTPMKKLPAEASSVSLRDARSLVTNSGTDTNSVNGRSSSSSGSPCTSPSW